MIKTLFTLSFVILTFTCSYTEEGDSDLYCWECECMQDGYTWTEELHQYTEEDIDQFILDDLYEPVPIYTKCYKFWCSDHSY